METLLQELDKLLRSKNLDIQLLKSDNDRLKKENEELRQYIENNKGNEETRG